MGLLKLGFVAVYLSDPIISGFTTGAAVLVFTSQVKHILGLTVPRYAGVFAVVKVCRYFYAASSNSKYPLFFVFFLHFSCWSPTPASRF